METETTKREFLSVTDLTIKLRSQVEPNFKDLWVQGEVSNFKLASSGHAYFVLKDADSMVNVTFFGFARKKTRFELQDGLQILAHGAVTIYPPRGSYQLNIDAVEPMGAGALQLAFEQLKAKLQSEGLFDPARKKALPKYPKKLVVITSPQAAAFFDVMTVLRRRAPFVEVLLVPSVVQGEDAPTKLVQALKVANYFNLGDAILLTRGGGSLEDLWCFNNEALAREIASSKIPIVTAVGHEVDFTIADFVSDLRAPTPSAGAEILTQHWVELTERTLQLNTRLARSMSKELLLKRRTLEALAAKIRSPRDKLREQAQRADDLSMRMERAISQVLERSRNQVLRLTGKLDSLSPLQVLSRGFALVQTSVQGEGDRVIRSAKEVSVGQMLQLRFAADQLKVRVEGKS